MKLNYLFIIVFFLFPSFLLSQTNQELEELKLSSLEMFNEGDYQSAMPLYSQLLSLYPSEAIYSYYYGACLVKNNKDIEKAIKYLTYSAKKLEDEPLVYYYLGSAYHLSYQFDKAIEQYEIFQAEASVSLQKETQVEREIKICNNGLDLVKYISPLTVLDNKSIRKENFEYSYEFDVSGGKVALKPDLFKTKADLKQKEKELIFISDSGIIMFSSLGKRNRGHKDIYWTIKGTNGKFSPSEKLSETINSEFDESFPFLKADGKTLYFSSKGHNTMGGFDIFKSVYDSSSGSWSQPQNLDFPTNTPYDDILYVIDAKDSIAFFASMRESEDELVNVYKIEVDHNPQKQSEVKLKDIQQLAKLLTTPLAIRKEAKISKEAETAIATTKVSDYKSTGPKTVFSFEEVYSKHLNSPEDYTKVLKNDIHYLKEKLFETESKTALASNMAHQRLGKLRELNDQIETRQQALSQKEQIENQELQQLIKTLFKTNNQAYIAAKVSETLSKEVATRKRELRITEMLLNDSSNNNTQELVQNINANRNFLEQNNKGYLSLHNFIKEKENTLNTLDQKSNLKKKDRSEKFIHFNSNLSDFKACLTDIKNKKDSLRATQAKSNLSSIKYELDLSKNNLIISEQNLKKHNATKQKLEEEIIVLRSLMNEWSDKEHLSHANQNNTLDHQLIVQNAEAYNNSTLALQSEQSKKKISSKYEQVIQPSMQTEKKLLADSKKNKPKKTKVNAQANPKALSIQTKISEQKKDPLNQNRTQLTSLRAEINGTNLAQVFSLDARIEIKKAQQNAQVSDSLFFLASEKETRVNFIPNAEQQDIIRDEIVELKQLSNIKAKQSTNGYKSALITEVNYITKEQPDTTLENLIKEKVFSFESSQDDSPELIEYKKATFKNQYYQSQLNRIEYQKEIIEKTLENDNTSPEVREKFQFELSELLQKETNINERLVETQKTEEIMEQLLITKGESYPISEAQKYAATTAKNLSPELKISKQQSKTLKSITEEQEKAKSLKNQWLALVENIDTLELRLSKTEAIDKKEDLNATLKSKKAEAWSIFKAANETQQFVHQTESKWLGELIQKQKEAQKDIKIPLAYVFEKESDLLIKNAANLRENTKLTENYSPAIAKVIEKAQLYESIAINRQKSAIDIYVHTQSSETNPKTKQATNQAFEENENTKPQIELLPDEADQVAEYEKAYNQAEAKEIKTQSYWVAIDGLNKNLETAYSTKEQNSILKKIEKQTAIAKEAAHSAFLIRKAANHKKFELYQAKNTKALKIIKDQSKTAIAKQYLLDASFYKSESEKVTIDPLLEVSDMLFQQDKKQAFENKALLAQEFAFATLNGDDISELNPYSSIVKSDPLYTKEQPIDKNLVQNVQSNRILKKINLNKSEIKELKKTKKTKKEQTKLRSLLIENLKTVEQLKDDFEKTSEAKSKEKIQNKIKVLEEEAISYQFSIAQNAEVINFEKYLAYKNHVKEHRLKGKGNQALTGRKLEKEANRSIRKAQNLRTRSYEVISSEKALNMLTEAQVLEEEALVNMEKAYTIYFDLLPIEHEVENYLAKTNTSDKESSQELIVVENKGKVEAFDVNAYPIDSAHSDLADNKDLTLRNDSNGIISASTDRIIQPEALPAIDGNIIENSKQSLIIDKSEALLEDQQDSVFVSEPIVENSEEDINEIIDEDKSKAHETANIIPIETPIEITEAEEQTIPVDTIYVSEENIDPIEQVSAETETSTVDSSLIKAELKNGLTIEEPGNLAQQSTVETLEPTVLEEEEEEDYKSSISTPVVESQEALVIEPVMDPIAETVTEPLAEAIGQIETETEAEAEAELKIDTKETPKTPETIHKAVSDPKIVPSKTQLQERELAQIVLEKAKAESVLSWKKASIYNKKNPIPVDPALPSGIIYKIQIGAFTKAIPQNSFNGLTPVSGESRKDSKYIRYFVGLFNAYEAAKVALPFIKQTGYKDAFIVAYKDGQRIAIYLAKKEHESNTNYPTLAKTETENVLKTIEANSGPISTTFITELINPSKNINSVNGVIFTVQIGVFKDEVSHSRLKNLSPLYKDFTNSGLIRYMVGQFTNFELANQKKIEIRNLGIKDAFVTAYKAGKKIAISQAREELKTVPPTQKEETPVKSEVSTTDNSKNKTTEPTESKISIPSNYNAAQLSFRVQIGVFSNTVPVEVVSSFIQLSQLNKLDQFVNLDGKTVYTLGSFKSLTEARTLKDDLLKKGITDAFIIAFDGQQKVPISEALKLLKP